MFIELLLLLQVEVTPLGLRCSVIVSVSCECVACGYVAFLFCTCAVFCKDLLKVMTELCRALFSSRVKLGQVTPCYFALTRSGKCFFKCCFFF